jgi:hypothetical protein
MAMQSKTLRVLITARDDRALAALLADHRLDTLGTPQRQEGGAVTVQALVSADRVDRLKEPGVTIGVLDRDAGATGRARQKQVGKGNRFTGKNSVPRGLGRKVKEGGRERS